MFRGKKFSYSEAIFKNAKKIREAKDFGGLEFEISGIKYLISLNDEQDFCAACRNEKKKFFYKITKDKILREVGFAEEDALQSEAAQKQKEDFLELDEENNFKEIVFLFGLSNHVLHEFYKSQPQFLLKDISDKLREDPKDKNPEEMEEAFTPVREFANLFTKFADDFVLVDCEASKSVSPPLTAHDPEKIKQDLLGALRASDESSERDYDGVNWSSSAPSSPIPSPASSPENGRLARQLKEAMQDLETTK